MKTKITIALLLITGALFAGCSGDQTAKNTKDTVHNTYHTKDTMKTADTSKVTSADNSAAGGTSALKDSVKQQQQ
jgi:hypothetical protein